MTVPSPLPTATGPHVVVAGSGIAAAEAVLAIGELLPLARLTVVSPLPDVVLRSDYVAEAWRGPARRLRIAELAGGRLAHVEDLVAHVDPGARRIRTARRRAMGYDALLVATGAVRVRPVTGALVVGMDQLTPDALATSGGRLAVVVPEGVTWSLPAYQVALAAAAAGSEVVVVTAEEAPLEPFGAAAGDVTAWLDGHGVRVVTGARVPRGMDARVLGDRVVSLPVLIGPRVAGLPADADGFLPVDASGRVPGAPGVHAAGDAAAGPHKSGGIGAQQAVAAVADIAGAAPPGPPVLHGRLAAGDDVLFLRRVLDGTDPGVASEAPLWHPPTALVAERLVRHIARSGGRITGSGRTTDVDAEAARMDPGAASMRL